MKRMRPAAMVVIPTVPTVSVSVVVPIDVIGLAIKIVEDAMRITSPIAKLVRLKVAPGQLRTAVPLVNEAVERVMLAFAMSCLPSSPLLNSIRFGNVLLVEARQLPRVVTFTKFQEFKFWLNMRAPANILVIVHVATPVVLTKFGIV